MAHTRAADNFQAICARMEELRRERERVEDAETDVRSVRLSLWCANGDPIIISVDRLRKELAGCPKSGAAGLR
jgi:hypothetical protein